MANPRKFSEKIALLNQKEAQDSAAFEAIMKEVSDVTNRTALSNLEEMQHNSMYRSDNRSRSMGVGPMRSRPMEKRHDTSPYSGVPYLSPPPPDTWRRTNSDSALHQSANEACQSASAIPHRRDQHAMTGSGNDNRDSHHGFIERPRSSCEMPRVPGIKYVLLNDKVINGLLKITARLRKPLFPFQSDPQSVLQRRFTTFVPSDRYRGITFDKNLGSIVPIGFIELVIELVIILAKILCFSIYPSSQPPGQQIPIGNNTGSLPDLSNVHFPSPLHTPLDQEDHSSSTPFSNSPQTSSPTNLSSPTSLAQAGRLSFSQDPSSVQNSENSSRSRPGKFNRVRDVISNICSDISYLNSRLRNRGEREFYNSEHPKYR
ncbi:hypothetical protein P5V15_009077 [Pogonomyrmex californicus]